MTYAQYLSLPDFAKFEICKLNDRIAELEKNQLKPGEVRARWKPCPDCAEIGLVFSIGRTCEYACQNGNILVEVKE